MRQLVLTAFMVSLTQLTVIASEMGFSRIIHGWTNYSTAFTATHDTDTNAGDYATLVSAYTPTQNVQAIDYGVIVVWDGEPGQHLQFNTFDFRVGIWSSLGAFTNSPMIGDVATVFFNAPTGGSISQRDATTRGGRAAYYVQFCLTNTPIYLAANRTYWIGFYGRTFVEDNGELFVPTSSHSGASDVQAGDLVSRGWMYLTNAGGNTIYSGQLATELFVRTVPASPRLTCVPIAGGIELSWPDSAEGFILETATDYSSSSAWSPVPFAPQHQGGAYRVTLPIGAVPNFYRLNYRP
jgi:hypothetical protein